MNVEQLCPVARAGQQGLDRAGQECGQSEQGTSTGRKTSPSRLSLYLSLLPSHPSSLCLAFSLPLSLPLASFSLPFSLCLSVRLSISLDLSVPPPPSLLPASLLSLPPSLPLLPHQAFTEDSFWT